MKTSYLSHIAGILLVSLLFRGNATAQDVPRTRITDPGEIYSTYNFSNEDRETVIRAVGQEKFERIQRSCREESWPEGIATLDKRTSRREEMKNYVVTLVAGFGEKSIVEITAEANSHMPAEMLSPAPFYFIIGNTGLNATEVTVGSQLEAATSLPDSDYFPMVQIVTPSDILPNYEFSSEEAADIIAQVGAEGFDIINSNCREDVWPDGINSEEKRLKAGDEIKDYLSFLVAETGDISVIEITPEENLFMLDEYIPDDTIYFVIRSEGIEILE